MVYVLGKTLELSALKGVDQEHDFKRNVADILCIDDQGLKYEGIIRHHGFSIRVLNDIEDIRQVSDYPIVICDIKGIGSKFNSPFEGGHIIQEIKKHYPQKIVVAFSGHQFDARYNKYFKMSDYVLTQDIDSDEWIEVLDEIIKKITCPIEQWKQMRQYLINKNVPLKTIFLLEQEYIQAMQQKDATKFAKEKTIKILPSDVRAIIQSFVASLIFKLVIG